MDPFTVDLKSFMLCAKVPKGPHLYYYTDFDDDEIIYIGESRNVQSRRRAHKKYKWFSEKLPFYILSVDVEDDRLCAEVVLILRHRPRHNKAIKLGIRNDGTVYALNFIRGR